MHKEAVHRFWSIFISEQGGVLCSMTSDVGAAFQNSQQGNNRALMAATPDVNDGGLRMRPAVTFHRENVFIPVPRIPQPAPEPPIPAVLPQKIEEPKTKRIEETKTPEVSPIPAPTFVPSTVTNETPKAAPVFFDVIVVDRNNRAVPDLEAKDFDVREDGKRQEVATFSRDRTPISIELLIDTSGSIAGKLKKIESAGASIIHQSEAGDECSLVEFKAEATVIQDFTTESAQTIKALYTLKAGGETALLDAVKMAVEYANKRSKNDRKAVVLITDGDERNSRCSRAEVLEILRSGNVQLYAIGFPEGLTASSPVRLGTSAVRSADTETRARGLLEELTQISGGRAFYPRSTEELETIALAISTDLRTQYRIGYYPTNSERKNQWREVKVEIVPGNHGDGRIARTRSGYLAR
jgi:Ca-activated chloride channel family protein